MQEKIKEYFPWIMAAVAVFLLLALVIVGLLSRRGISANRASMSEVSAEVDRLSGEIEQAAAEIEKLKAAIEQADTSEELLREELREELTADISANADRLQKETASAKFQVLLLKAAAKTLKARIHLAEKEAGLAERDLAECDAALEAAITLADAKTKTTLQEIRSSIVELKDSIEARTFPLATLEIVSDKIDALIGE